MVHGFELKPTCGITPHPLGTEDRGRKDRTPKLCLPDCSLKTARLNADHDATAAHHKRKDERIERSAGKRHGIVSRTAKESMRVRREEN